jgi:hypothetical protein
MPNIAVLILVGAASGLASGVFGIGGGVLIVPGLIYLAGFSQHRATGTSLAVLLPPVGLAATLEYYRHGDVDVRAAMIIAALVFVGSWAGAVLAEKVSGPYLRLAFGLFTVALGVSLVFGAAHRLGWI